MIAPVVIGNWKMHKTPSETEAFLSEALPALRDVAAGGAVVTVVAPAFTSIPLAARMLAGSGVGLSAQDCHWSEEGAFTGEVSPKMLAEAGCRYAILGHSERREFFAETNHRVNLKVKAALFWGMTPVVCVGEKRDERDSGRATLVVERQLERCLTEITLDKSQRVMVAYEPVWAIGTGLTPSPAEIEEMHRFIHRTLAVALGVERAAGVPILYGGSVAPGNAPSFFASDLVDGARVGGASLDPNSFLALVQQARDAGPSAPRA